MFDRCACSSGVRFSRQPHRTSLPFRANDAKTCIDELKSIGDFPIIVVSGDSNPKLHETAIQRGIYQFLGKPVSMTLLEEVVRESLVQSAIQCAAIQ